MNTGKQYGKNSVAKSDNYKKVIVFGIFAVDISFYTSRQVKAGETLIANSSKIGPGGKASNQAIASKKLGAETLLISRLRNDNFKDYAIGVWEKIGLKYLFSIDNKNPTGKAGIFINNNKRVKNRELLDKKIQDIFSNISDDKLIKRLEDASIAYGRLNSVNDLAKHLALKKIDVYNSEAEELSIPSPPLVWNKKKRRAPKFNEHGKAIRKEFSG